MIVYSKEYLPCVNLMKKICKDLKFLSNYNISFDICPYSFENFDFVYLNYYIE